MNDTNKLIILTVALMLSGGYIHHAEMQVEARIDQDIMQKMIEAQNKTNILLFMLLPDDQKGKINFIIPETWKPKDK